MVCILRRRPYHGDLDVDSTNYEIRDDYLHGPGYPKSPGSEAMLRSLAKNFKLRAGGTLDEFSKDDSFDILVNCTSIGFKSPDKSPILKNKLQNDLIVMDAVFIPFETRLIKEANETGCTTIPGVRMLLHQACGQVELYTGHDAPFETMERVINRELKKLD